mmetsp:Transcript_50278/g.118979  ORF Transcript_50278/g.118979 Transcript_50278/m.118979 type:complete len:231 (+) Transcript_50278:57-749(+)
MSETGKPDGIPPADQLEAIPFGGVGPAIDFANLSKEMSIQQQVPKLKVAVKNYLSARMAEAMTQSGGVSAQEAKFRCSQLQLMARHSLKAMNAAAPPAEGGGEVGESWRQATSAEGAKTADLFGKHLIDAPEFAPAVEEALKLVVAGAASTATKDSDTEEALLFFKRFAATANDDPEELRDVCWSDDWQGALRRRTLKREEAAKEVYSGDMFRPKENGPLCVYRSWKKIN